jgi:hypothetical protein
MPPLNIPVMKGLNAIALSVSVDCIKMNILDDYEKEIDSFNKYQRKI